MISGKCIWLCVLVSICKKLHLLVLYWLDPCCLGRGNSNSAGSTGHGICSTFAPSCGSWWCRRQAGPVMLCSIILSRANVRPWNHNNLASCRAWLNRYGVCRPQKRAYFVFCKQGIDGALTRLVSWSQSFAGIFFCSCWNCYRTTAAQRILTAPAREQTIPS